VLRRLAVLIRFQPDVAREAGLVLGLAGASVDPWAWEKEIARTVAYLGRYGRIPAETVLTCSPSFARGLMREVSALLRMESEAGKSSPLSALGRDEWI
jgi:hypothetical protein